VILFLLFILGLGLLTGGADLLVRGAARLAAVAGIAPVIVGLTVVAFGTSAPELAVTVTAAIRGEPDMALGNVVGSNIANVLLILGVAALVAPLVVRRRVIRFDLPILVGVSIVVVVMALDSVISRIEGAILVAGAFGYTGILVHQARHPRHRPVPDPGHWIPKRPRHHVVLDLFFVVAGIALMVFGSHWLVEAARTIAEALGVSHLAIGLTIVAIGTSLPELATSVVASVRGHRDIAVGNIIGSNLYNLLLVLGGGAAASPGGITAPAVAIAFDLPVMLGVTLACIPIFVTGRVVARSEAFVFVAYFIAYTTYVLLTATGHEATPLFRHALIFFVLPLSALTLGFSVFRAQRAGPTEHH
jgi:cation:H+ antiporter